MTVPKRGEIPAKDDAKPEPKKWDRDTLLGTQSAPGMVRDETLGEADVVPAAKPVAAPGMEITEGTRAGFTQIAFEGKPSEEIRAKLKAAKYRWSPKNKVWYGKTDALPDLGDTSARVMPFDDKSRGVRKDEARSVLAEFKQDIGGRAEFVPIEFSDKDSSKKAEHISTPQGDSIIIYLNNHNSKEDIYSTLKHEWVIHHGLNTFTPADKKKIINRLRASKGEQSLRKAWEFIRQNYSNESPEKQAEELLAYMAENKATRLSKLWNDLVLMVEKLLRKVGIIKKNRVTKADIVRFIEDLTARVGAGATQQTFPEGIDISNRTVREAVSSIDEKSKGASAKIKHWVRRHLTKEGLLNEPAFEAKLRKDAEKNVGESDLSAMVYDFEKAVEAAYGVSYNKMTDADLAEVNAYLAGEKGIALPKGLHRKLDHLRAYLDRLSAGMQVAMTDMLKIEATKLSEKEQIAFGLFLAGSEDGYLPKSMQKHWNLYNTIENNKGTYLNRSYQAFDDENWKDKTLKNKDLINRAQEFIAEENPELTRMEVIGAVRSILQNAKKNGNFEHTSELQ